LLVDLDKSRGRDYPLNEVLLAIRNKIQEYWGHINEMTHVATFFDPDIKQLHIKV
jgi:hypothetical protein